MSLFAQACSYLCLEMASLILLGECFVNALACSISSHLRMKYVIIGALDESSQSVNSLAFAREGLLQPNLSYTLVLV